MCDDAREYKVRFKNNYLCTSLDGFNLANPKHLPNSPNFPHYTVVFKPDTWCATGFLKLLLSAM